MARGFESKDVEFQQALAADRAKPGRATTAEDRQRAERRQTIELSLSRMRADLARATAAAHRRMIASAIATLEAELRVS